MHGSIKLHMSRLPSPQAGGILHERELAHGLQGAGCVSRLSRRRGRHDAMAAHLDYASRLSFTGIKACELVNTETSLFLGLLFSCIGLGYSMYGKQQRMGIPLACGFGLMLFPYFVSNLVLYLLIGLSLMAIPYFLRF
jgi:hypothetical protein